MGAMEKIYEALVNRKEKICARSEIDSIINEYNNRLGKVNPQNALKYLVRHRYLMRIFMKFFYINSPDERQGRFCRYEDKELLFAVLNKLNIKWYVGLNSSLYLLGKAWQTPNTIIIINNKISGKKRILGLNVKFAKIKDNLIFGLKTGKTKNNISYSYSGLAKTYIDIAYFRQSNKIITAKETKSYLKRYPKWLSRLM
ncbi:MAG: hypothetical protein KJ955_08415 [Nanoarchaeota archaeon]|nr:hypothetical protein [Nanoarchaeota archaeon]